MLDKLLINAIEVNSVIDGSEIKIYNKNDITKFGIKADTIIVSGESKMFIPEITKAFGITSIKLLKQLLSNKSVKESGKFELIKENNQFSNQEEISTLTISSNNIKADIRLASEDVLQKIPVANNVTYNIACVGIESSVLTKLSKDIELLSNNDEYFTVEVDDKELKFKSGNVGQNLITITCPFECDSNEFLNNIKYKCKDIIAGIKIASKFEKADIKINNSGLFTFTCENEDIKLYIHIRGSVNVVVENI